jgi:hypothetical protein
MQQHDKQGFMLDRYNTRLGALADVALSMAALASGKGHQQNLYTTSSMEL